MNAANKQYGRLTKKGGYTKELDLKQELGYSYIYNRLAELEDKIEKGTLVPKYSIVDCGDTYCVCTVDTNNLLVIDEYETEAEAEKRLEEIRNE
jgi:hypothetical protein